VCTSALKKRSLQNGDWVIAIAKYRSITSYLL